MFFSDQDEFREWLAGNYETATELVVIFYKKGSGKASMTWSESVDQALCFGWIDGITRSLDAERFTVRFTPRRPNSAWSAVNIEKVKRLTELGLMLPKGLAVFENRRDKDSEGYRFRDFSGELTDEMSATFRANTAAWTFFEAQPPGYRRVALYWVMSAKQEKTRLARIEKLITVSEAGKRL